MLLNQFESGATNPFVSYCDGEKPISKWTKEDLLKEFRTYNLRCSYEILSKFPLSELKRRFLKWKSSKYVGCRKVDFFVIDKEKVCKVSDAELAIYRASMSMPKPEPKKEVWKCSFYEWYGTQYSGLTCVKKTEVGTICGIWFYRENGTKKKITSKGFEMLERVA